MVPVSLRLMGLSELVCSAGLVGALRVGVIHAPTASMMARPEITGSYNFITHNAARTLSLSDYGIEVGNTANFIVLDAEDWFHALSFGAPVLANFRAGRVLAECEPLARRVHF